MPAAYTHLYIANATLDAIRNGTRDGDRIIVSLQGKACEKDDIAITQSLANLLTSEPESFRAGSLGPDFFPDVFVGIAVSHQPDLRSRTLSDFHDVFASTIEDATPSQLAFAFGWLCHVCADVFGHHWVGMESGGDFFDEVDHDWLTCMLEQRINDRAFIGLIRKWLKAGVLEPGAQDLEMPEAGTPQGGIISPVLANIYLHFILDLWIQKVVKKHSAGEVLFMRYADDIIVGFEYKRDADNYLRVLPKRLKKFALRLAEEKSSLVKFNRWEPDDSGKFTFLGFDFYWARTRKNPNHKMVRRRTNKKKYQGALQAMKEWIKKARNWPLKMILSSLRRRLRGYWNYYCVIANSHMNWRYYSAVKQ